MPKITEFKHSGLTFVQNNPKISNHEHIQKHVEQYSYTNKTSKYIHNLSTDKTSVV
jgi:hypothetical protein